MWKRKRAKDELVEAYKRAYCEHVEAESEPSVSMRQLKASIVALIELSWGASWSVLESPGEPGAYGMQNSSLP